MEYAATIAAVLACLASIAAAIFSRRAASGNRDAAVVAKFADTVRTENERARAAAEEHARGLRQEIGDKLRAGSKLTDDRVNAIGTKLDADIALMGRDAVLGREALRDSVAQRLKES